MRKVVITLTFVTVSAVIGLAQTEKRSTDEEEIQRVNAREVQALLQSDAKTLGTLWSDDFVVTNPLNQFITKPRVINLVSSGTLAFSSFDRKTEYVRFYGDIAILAGSETVVWAGKMPLAGETSHVRFTAVWQKQNGTWQEVARHANIIPPQQPGLPGTPTAPIVPHTDRQNP
jgi:ketosteroid isomerase-like protein